MTRGYLIELKVSIDYTDADQNQRQKNVCWNNGIFFEIR